MTDPSDAALVAAFLAERSEAAFGALYARHAPAMYGLARRLMGADAAAADDVAQDSWVRAIGALQGFRGDAALRSWLCGIVVNCCRERWRARPPTSLDTVVESTTTSPDHAVALEDALARLAPGYRAVVVLHDLFGYTHDEIAGQLGIEPGTSKSQLARGRRALREVLRPIT